MEFLVKIEVSIPFDYPTQQFNDLLIQERNRGKELKALGHIFRIWRVPGTRNNVGIWKAKDASELHSILSSLPLFEIMTIEVVALAVHPLEEDMN